MEAADLFTQFVLGVFLGIFINFGFIGIQILVSPLIENDILYTLVMYGIALFIAYKVASYCYFMPAFWIGILFFFLAILVEKEPEELIDRFSVNGLEREEDDMESKFD